jgi:superoxide dismutase, Cu-Zn family
MKRWVGMGAGTAVVAVTVGMMATGRASAGDEGRLTAVLRDAGGVKVGTVHFDELGGETWVSGDFLANGHVKAGFHGFHVHANDLADGGTGCVADPKQASSTWFVSADGHYAGSGTTHGTHAGDMPSVLVQDDGTARLQFTTRALALQDLLGKAVVLHAGADNFGNVPVGSAADQYTANSADATTKTAKTGNAGDRVACGVIQESTD